MNHFYLTYYGNKYSESKNIESLVNTINGVESIVEPFCGSFGFSRYYHDKFSECKFFLFDIDATYIEFVKLIKNDNNIIYDIVKSRSTFKDQAALKAHYINHEYNKYYPYIKLKLVGPNGLNQRNTKNFKQFDYNKLNTFIDNNILLAQDYKITFGQFKDDDKALLYLDPPYLNSYNKEYAKYDGGIDLSNIYIEILEFLKICKCKVIMIVPDCAIIRYIFKDFIHSNYNKKYQPTKREIKHIIISKNL